MTDYLLLKDTVFKTRPSRNKCQDPNSSPLLTRILHGDVLFPSCVPFTGVSGGGGSSVLYANFSQTHSPTCLNRKQEVSCECQ